MANRGSIPLAKRRLRKMEHGFSSSRGDAKGNFLLPFFAPLRLGEKQRFQKPEFLP
jgi:hypothetical protein